MDISIAIVCILIIAGCLIVSLISSKSILFPASVVSLSWLIVVSSYINFHHELYALSNNLYIALIIWVVSFCGACFCFKHIVFHHNPLYEFLNIKLIKFGCEIFFLINCWGCYEYLKLGNGGMAYNALADIARGEVDLPLTIRLLQALKIISTILFVIVIFYHRQLCLKKIIIVSFCLTLALWIIISGDKTAIMQIFFAFFCKLIIEKSKYLKWSVVGFVCIVLFLIMIQNLRASDKEKEVGFSDIVTTYVLSSLPAFDAVTNGEKNFSEGKTTRFLTSILTKAHIISAPKPETETGWIQVPVYTNVYTVMFPSYVDYGYMGILFMAFFQGTFWTILYNQVLKRSISCTILFASYYYTLPFQFFSDYISNYTSVFIQSIIIIWLFTTRFKKIKL